MLKRTITPKEAESRFYLHNERLAKEWENYIEEVDGEIEGEVNSYFISFVAHCKFGGLIVKVESLRQLSNNVAEIHHDYLITKSTDITIKGLPNNGNWKVRKKRNLVDFIIGIFSSVISIPKIDKYVLVSKGQINSSYPEKVLQLSLKIAEIRDLKYENGQLIIRFHNFLGPLSVRKVINSLF